MSSSMTETAMSLDDYPQLTPDAEFPERTSYRAVHTDGSSRWLTVFSSDVSANQDFRAAWRHDTELLLRLPHDGLPPLLDTGDDDGVVYLASEFTESLTLDEYLASHTLTWEETADLGWQAASVIQHLHNSGIAHSGLNGVSFRITQQLRVQLVDAGITRWVLAATKPGDAGDLNAQFRADLVALGRLLEQLAAADETDPSHSSDVPQQWWKLIADLSDASGDRFPTTAREVQGRLGAILLEGPGESMDVVADRTGPGRASRSIVDELLDVPLDDSPDEQKETSFLRPTSDQATWALLAIAVVLICMAVIVFLSEAAAP